MSRNDDSSHDTFPIEWQPMKADDDIELRPELDWFAKQMELRLREHDDKGTQWKGDPPSYNMQGIRRNLEELAYGIMLGDDDQVAECTVDVANLCMFIAANWILKERSLT